jgi:uncharacterized protein
MEPLNEYGRPFHQRATEMVIPPLSPPDVGELLDLEDALSRSTSPLLVSGGRALAAEFPPAAQWSR